MSAFRHASVYLRCPQTKSNPLENRGEERGEEKGAAVGEGRKRGAFQSTKRTNPFNPFCSEANEQYACGQSFASSLATPFVPFSRSTFFLLFSFRSLCSPPPSPLCSCLCSSFGKAKFYLLSLSSFFLLLISIRESKALLFFFLFSFLSISFFFLTFSPGERISREGGSMGERRENVGQILLDGVINGGGKRVKRLIRSVRGFRWIGDDKYLARECFGCVPRLT